jgi:hypothetical protein
MRYARLSVSELLVNSINGFPFPGGLGMGKPIYLVPEDSATSYFRGWLRKNGAHPADIYATLPEAFAATVPYRNDTIFAFPGDYENTAELDWDHDFVHLVGVDSNIEGDHTQGGVNIFTDTVDVVNTIDITGKRCIFQNAKIANAGADAHNLQAVFLRGEGAIFRNVAISGALAATQCDTALATSLCIGRGGYFPRFYDCVIGNNTQTTRTGDTNSHLHITSLGGGAYPPDNGLFKNCKFLSISVDVTTPMVYILTHSIDRIWLFDECSFYNYYTAAGTNLNEVFHDDDTFYTHQIVLKNCLASGYDEWSDSDIGFKNIQSNMPITGLGGGLTRPPTAVVGS